MVGLFLLLESGDFRQLLESISNKKLILVGTWRAASLLNYRTETPIVFPYSHHPFLNQISIILAKGQFIFYM